MPRRKKTAMLMNVVCAVPTIGLIYLMGREYGTTAYIYIAQACLGVSAVTSMLIGRFWSRIPHIFHVQAIPVAVFAIGFVASAFAIHEAMLIMGTR